ncbi:MAG: HU family DNA-binding protein [Bacilli bacterium]|nr:HU family DNA-binding protein [Bacilli bacterium]
MKKKDIVDVIYQNSEYKKADIEDIVGMVFEVMASGLALEDKIMISNFGTFEKIYQEEYMGVHPVTGAPQKNPASYRIRFVSSKNLKDIINERK